MNCRRQFARASSVGWLFARAACRGSLKQSQNILVDSSSTEEIPLPGEQPPVYSDFMAKVHLTDTESEAEAAGEAAKEAALPMGWKIEHPAELAPIPQGCCPKTFLRRTEIGHHEGS